MKRKISLILFATLIITTAIFAQDHFLVEFEKFTPPTQDIIRQYEGFPATPFMAKDMTGKEHYLGNYRGKVCILIFWNTQNSTAASNMHVFNDLRAYFNKNYVEFVSLADENRDEMRQYLETTTVDFPVIPNGSLFGEAAYSKDLGYPRVFIIDKNGIIRKVIPEDTFNQGFDMLDIMKGTIKKYL